MDILIHLREALAAYRARDFWLAIRHLLHVAAAGTDALAAKQSTAPAEAMECPTAPPSFPAGPSGDDAAAAALESMISDDGGLESAAAFPWATALPLVMDMLRRLLNRQ